MSDYTEKTFTFLLTRKMILLLGGLCVLGVFVCLKGIQLLFFEFYEIVIVTEINLLGFVIFTAIYWLIGGGACLVVKRCKPLKSIKRKTGLIFSLVIAFAWGIFATIELSLLMCFGISIILGLTLGLISEFR